MSRDGLRIAMVTRRRMRLWEAAQVRCMTPAERWAIVFRGTAVECLN